MAGLIWLWQGSPLDSSGGGSGKGKYATLPWGEQPVDYSQWYYPDREISTMRMCQLAVGIGLV